MPVGVGAKPVTPAAAAPAAAKPAAPPSAPPAGAAEGKKGGKLKLILIIVVTLILLAGIAVGVLFALKALGILGGGESEEPQAEETSNTVVIGTQMVSTGEAMNINLADGYLSFVATVYFDAALDEESGDGGQIDASPARAAALDLFSGMSLADVQKPGAKKELEVKYAHLLNEEVMPPYHGHVAVVRFTTFVSQ